jgi:hypothetical protein
MLAACLPDKPSNTSPVAIVTMNARQKGTGYTTSPSAGFWQASNVLFSSASAASDSCTVQVYNPTGGGLTSATAIGAGSGVAISVSGRTDTLKRVSASDATYRLTNLVGVAFTPGDSIKFETGGDLVGYPKVIVTGKTAEPFTMSAIAVPALGATLPITWTLPDDNRSAMLVALRFATGTTLDRQIFCDFRDDGAGTVPANLVSQWAASSVRDVFVQRLRTVVAIPTGSGAYFNLISTFDRPTPVSP